MLCELQEEFKKRGLFISGDSAYSPTPFLVSPYHVDEIGDDVNGALDSFNFHHSSCCIYIECAFGEFIMRWGIFWRTLRFDLAKSAKIVQVGMLLHNFIIEMREPDAEDARFFREFDVPMDSMQRELIRLTGEMPMAVCTDNNEPAERGRKRAVEVVLIDAGRKIRQRLTAALASNGMRRPLTHGMEYNKHGNIYLT